MTARGNERRAIFRDDRAVSSWRNWRGYRAEWVTRRWRRRSGGFDNRLTATKAGGAGSTR